MIGWTTARKRQRCCRPDCNERAVLTQGLAGRCEAHKPTSDEVVEFGIDLTLDEGDLPPHLRAMLRAAETRLACEAARRRGRMYLADAASDPDTARQVIREMVALLEQAPAARMSNRVQAGQEQVA